MDGSARQRDAPHRELNPIGAIGMKVLRTIFKSAQQTCALVSLGIVLLATAGCGPARNEQEGDLPPNQGEYRVSVSPDGVTLTPESPTAAAIFNVACGGQFPPAGCFNNDPVWVVNHPQSAAAALTVVSPHTPITPVTVAGNSSYLTSGQFSSLGFGPFRIYTVKPTQIPAGLQLTGRPFLDVNFNFPPPGGVRTAVPASKARLVAFVTALRLSRDGSTNSIVNGFTALYEGPPDAVLSISEGGKDTGKFQVLGPKTPFNVENTVAFTVSVVFLGTPASDPNVYSVDVTIVTVNGLIATVPVVCTE
jgi:hypothetical protein